MHEQRLTDRLTKYWDMLRKEESIPVFGKFNSSAIDDVWGHCVLFAVNSAHNDNHSYTFYRMGDKVKELYKEDLTGNTLNPKQKMFKGAAIVKRMDEVVKGGAPVHDSGQFINPSNKIVKFRSCLLPFGNGKEVTHVIAGISWREFS